MKCRLCSNNQTHHLFTSGDTHGRHILGHDRFGIYYCMNCKVTFTDVDLSDEYYGKYYLDNYYDLPQFNSFIIRILSCLEEISFRHKLKLIRQYKPRGNNILEIGCAKGGFLNKLPSEFTKHGVEINESGYRYVKEHYSDITVYNKKIDDESFDNGGMVYDVIVMWHVIEHVDDPERFMKSLSKLLSKDGIIIFDVPNRNSIGFKWTKQLWYHLDTPRHLFHYNYESLKLLFEKFDLFIVRYLGNVVDYPHDLAVSFISKFRTPYYLLNMMAAAAVVPSSILMRLFASAYSPRFAEINTYIVKRVT